MSRYRTSSLALVLDLQLSHLSYLPNDVLINGVCVCVYRVNVSGLDTESREFIFSGRHGRDQARIEPRCLTALHLNPVWETLK